MFTGIIQTRGTITDIAETSHDTLALTIRAPKVLTDVSRGDSIAIDGVCLTVTEFTAETFTADVMVQTLNLTSLGTKAVGDEVNVEPAMAVTDRFGGHIVQGHVEAVGSVVEIEADEKWTRMRLSLPAHLAPYLIDQGSITVDGISLTVAGVSAQDAVEHYFDIFLIPETLEATTLGNAEVGTVVNLETDLLARHLARMIQFQTNEGK
ncbi:riboflavin synthase [Enteractinococcus coprophilus]|uniref:Riboflavin synthase n=1 Tax=Enteractinococcus coprophilus TaxID=1027633 RepID=A0A543AJS3_9MICC|nr:riboflavin synthase [Enteractinococcus coprophilus]TQL72819.1 riboflavin synthase alpha chain [Enteractinococcus coprophilus]